MNKPCTRCFFQIFYFTCFLQYPLISSHTFIIDVIILTEGGGVNSVFDLREQITVLLVGTRHGKTGVTAPGYSKAGDEIGVDQVRVIDHR